MLRGSPAGCNWGGNSSVALTMVLVACTEAEGEHKLQMPPQSLLCCRCVRNQLSAAERAAKAVEEAAQLRRQEQRGRQEGGQAGSTTGGSVSAPDVSAGFDAAQEAVPPSPPPFPHAPSYACNCSGSIIVVVRRKLPGLYTPDCGARCLCANASSADGSFASRCLGRVILGVVRCCTSCGAQLCSYPRWNSTDMAGDRAGSGSPGSCLPMVLSGRTGGRASGMHCHALQ